jgi:hypothetical protein
MTRTRSLLLAVSLLGASCTTLLGADEPTTIGDASDAGPGGPVEDAAPLADTGVTDAAVHRDGGASDAGVDAGGGGSDARVDGDGGTAVEAGLGPSGIQIVAGPNLSLPGLVNYTSSFVTSDGYVPYTDYNAGFSYVVRLAAGSTPILLGPAPNQVILFAEAQGAALLVWSYEPNVYIPLYGFSAATGVTMLAKQTLLPLAAQSTDGTRVVLWDVDDSGLWRLRAMNVDGSNAVVLVSSLPSAGPSAAYPGTATFAGSRSDRVVASWCPSVACDDMVLHSFSITGSTFTDLALGSLGPQSGISGVQGDPAGDLVATGVPDGPAPEAGSATYHLSVFNLATGVETVIAPDLSALGYFSGTGSGERISYLTPTAYALATVAHPTPVTLLQSGPFSPGAVFPSSADGAYTLLSQAWSSSDPNYDLILAPATQPGGAVALSAVAGFFGDYWTADGSHALWADSPALFQQTEYVGTLVTAAVPTGARETLDFGVSLWWPLTASKVAALAQAAPDFSSDLVVYDLASSPAKRQLVVSGIWGYGVPTPDRKQLVYGYGSSDLDGGSPLDGIWMAPVP